MGTEWRDQDSFRIVILSPGLREKAVWGEAVSAHNAARYLPKVFPGARVFTFDRDDLEKIAAMKVDLLISYYTGPEPPWRVDDIASLVDGITLLRVYNHGDLLDQFAKIPVNGYITNSRPAARILAQARPASYIPLAVDDGAGRVEPDVRYRADVVFLGSGGRGNKRPETTRRYLDPAKKFDFALWGSYWDRDYWARVYADNPESNDWHRFWRGPLPLGEIQRLYSSAAIVLNYHEDSQRRWGMWNNRVFEALACGSLLICDDAAGLAEEFGDAIAITSGGAETERLIAHYLAHPEERRRRGEIGRRIVQQRYTYSRWALSVRDFYERLVRDRSASRS